MFFGRKIKNQRGQGLVEYAMLLGLIAIACVATVTMFSGVVQDTFYAVITDTVPS
jgi:Flp pilus assembly pilin Flp